MKITIAGKAGSGKTSVAETVAKRLGYKHYSAGDLRGRMAMDMGITIDELNEIGKKESWTDTKIDEQSKKIGETEDNFVMDTWLGFHFIPDSLKIFLDVSLGEGARRIFLDQRPDEKKQDSIEGVKEMIKKRQEENRVRWKKRYRVDYLDMANYDFVLDTTGLTKEEVIQKVIDYIRSKQ